MSFAVTIDSLREHQSSVEQRKWESLLLNWNLILRIEEEIAGVMNAADIGCAVLLTPQPEIGAMLIEHQWIGKNAVNCGPVEDSLFTYVVFKTLLIYVGV